ncbi:tripartite tricarboxylate transporter TctB family protein [Salinisphaera aquimarina]|uniref:Tripartite tricarboxylate transporter TctB family protein n=1 Tax=Salinisphaera aquimarina TaxID=2094031 RepID=A0ABV7ESX8_9GAMM
MRVSKLNLAVNTGCLGLSAALLYLSFNGEMPRAYLFPKIISGSMLLLAIAIALSEWRRVATPAEELISKVPWAKVFPALMITGAYLLLLNRLGFYTSSLLMFFAVVVIYTPENRRLRRVLMPAIIAIGFMAFVYLVFAKLLQVLPPTGSLM